MSRVNSFRNVLPPTLALTTSDIHIWRSRLDLPSFRMDQLERTLSIDELGRAARFCFERDRKRFVAARGVLRAILGLYLDIHPREIRFEYGAHGKPTLQRDKSEAVVCFNLSHSNGLALFAITRGREVGVDVEYARPLSDAEQIAERFFSAEENFAFRAISADLRLNAFYSCWARKEAYIKAIGMGLSLPLDRFDVSLTPGEPARLLSIDGDKQRAAEWTIIELLPAPSHIAAIAVKGRELITSSIDCEKYFQPNVDVSNALATD